MRKFLGICALCVACFVVVSCGAGVSGTYSDGMGVSSYTFKSGKVIVSAMGMEIEQKYKVDGDKIKIISDEGTLVLKIVDDKTIEGPMGITLTKE